MRYGLRQGSFLVLVMGGLNLFILTSPARAQDPDLSELRTRLEKLEKQNAVLRQVRMASPPAAPDGKQLKDTDVKKIVGDYLQEQDQKKKQEDAAKAKEAQEKGVEVGSDLKMTASWTNGMVLQTANQDFKIHLGGKFQDDWDFFNEPGNLKAATPVGVGNLQDGTFFRRIHLVADGTAYEVFEFQTEFDFENISRVVFNDMWMGATKLPILGTVRVGNHKIPHGLESFTPENFLTFMERAAINDAFLQNFNPGIFESNNILDQRVTWETMFHRIPRITDLQTGADFGNGELAATGRITGLPYYANDGRYLVHLGASYQFREGKFDAGSGNDTVQFRTRPEIFASNGAATNSDANFWLDTGLIQAENVQSVGGNF